MKKILSLISAMIIAVCTLTSCDEDMMISYNLEGTWEGNMCQVSTYNGRQYAAAETEIEFIPYAHNSTSGEGYWIDYYSNAPWDKWANHIKWYVNDRIIRIHFVEDNTDIEIHDFKLNNTRFEGWFYDDAHTVCNFSLRHTSSGNWDSYDSWGYNYYDDYYYSKATRGITNDSVVTSKEKPVRKTLKSIPVE